MLRWIRCPPHSLQSALQDAQRQQRLLLLVFSRAIVARIAGSSQPAVRATRCSPVAGGATACDRRSLMSSSSLRSSLPQGTLEASAGAASADEQLRSVRLWSGLLHFLRRTWRGDQGMRRSLWRGTLACLQEAISRTMLATQAALRVRWRCCRSDSQSGVARHADSNGSLSLSPLVRDRVHVRA